MKKYLVIGYLVLFGCLSILFYFEFNNYKVSSEVVDMSDYKTEIKELNDNISFIEEINSSSLEKSIIEDTSLCLKKIEYLEVINSEELKIKDLYNLNQKFSTSNYPLQHYYDNAEVESIHKSLYKEISFYEYAELHNDNDLNDLFKNIIDREIFITDAFIEGLELSIGEENV